ncbi:hypothetical protein [Paenibacillus prosopidis]|uniref:hypothetical protein n=1 Tax=Paenibacillus prosopidis TaxID=630520 RepID=UPI0015F193D8|nr:hypothetical protein [Paenibacillus prosopidis]
MKQPAKRGCSTDGDKELNADVIQQEGSMVAQIAVKTAVIPLRLNVANKITVNKGLIKQ